MRAQLETYLCSTVLAGLLIASLSNRALADADHNLERTFEVAPGGKCVLQADQGSCLVNPGDGTKVEIRVFRHVKGGNKAQADDLFANHEVTFVQEGSTVSVVAKNKKNIFGSWRPN